MTPNPHAMRTVRGVVAALTWQAFPRGGELPEDVWNKRHRGFLLMLWTHVVAVPVFGLERGFGWHAVLEASLLAIPALVATLARSRAVAALAATFGLFTASATLVHFSGGTIEAHFHFFVMVTLISLYEAWVPYLLAIAYVVLHHATIGIVEPAAVFNHPAAIAKPVLWASIHGVFILMASVAGLVVWKRNEEMRDRLRSQLDEEQRLNRALDEFSGTVAHDLKSHLASVKSAAELLGVEQLSDDRRHELADLLLEQAGDANELVMGLLALARASGTPSRQSVDLFDLVVNVASVTAGVEVEVRDVPEEIDADPIAIRQAVSNLFQNAGRYAKNGSALAQITVSGEELDSVWRLVVSDRGPGLDPDVAYEVFHPFRRGRVVDEDGAGLGLAIVQAVASAHGGSAWHEPRPGGGSSFVVEIAKVRSAEVASGVDPTRSAGAPSSNDDSLSEHRLETVVSD